MYPYKIERGRYRVVRMCCQSGNCFHCQGLHQLDRRKPVVVLDQLSEKTAREIADRWHDYDPTIELMP